MTKRRVIAGLAAIAAVAVLAWSNVTSASYVGYPALDVTGQPAPDQADVEAVKAVIERAF